MTDSVKFSLGILALLFGLYLINQNSQQKHTLEGTPIFSGDTDDIHRFVISEANESIEIIKHDTTWSIVGSDSLLIKDHAITNFFDRVLQVETEMLISSKVEKWTKFGVDDSLGKQLQVYSENNEELLSYVFGNSGQDYQHNYIRSSHEDDVYRTNDNVYFVLSPKATYWGKQPEKPKPVTPASVSD